MPIRMTYDGTTHDDDALMLGRMLAAIRTVAVAGEPSGPAAATAQSLAAAAAERVDGAGKADLVAVDSQLGAPAGHYREITTPHRRGRGERWIIGAGAAMLAVLAVAVVIAFTSVQRRSRHGCIDVSAATFIGGSELYRCGATARELCQSPAATTHYLAFRRALATSCRKAGLPVPAVDGRPPISPKPCCLSIWARAQPPVATDR